MKEESPKGFDPKNYESVRKTDAMLDQLLTRWQEIDAFQQSGSGTHEDSREKEKLEDQIRAHLQEK